MRNFGAVATTVYSFRLHFHLLWISGFADEAFRSASAFIANFFDASDISVDTNILTVLDSFAARGRAPQ
jgi:hypothetical protein